MPRPVSVDKRSVSDSLWVRPVLVGNGETLPALAAQSLAAGISPAAVIDVDAREGDQRLSSLVTLHGGRPFTGALVSLPLVAGPAILKVRSLLRSLNIVERFVPA